MADCGVTAGFVATGFVAVSGWGAVNGKLKPDCPVSSWARLEGGRPVMLGTQACCRNRFNR